MAKTRKSASKHRASWKGNITFGLVSFPVEAFNALNREGSDIHFHQLHEKCHNRIHYQKVCPKHGVVSNEEIVSGYEYKKGKYIEIDPEELDAARSKQERALKIDAFIPPETVDPLYFDGRMYYLLPSGAGAQEPYEIFVQAMERKERYGVGQVTFSGKDQIVLLRPLEGVLHMAMLNYEAEIRSPGSYARSRKKPRAASKQLRLAQTLIDSWSEDDFDFSDYEDEYRERVKELIDAKVKGHDLVAPEEEEEEPEVYNLMDALKKSIAQVRPSRGTSKARKRRRSA